MDDSISSVGSNGSNYSESQFRVPKVILTAKEIQHVGLRLVNYTVKRILRVKTSNTNKQRFKDHFGCPPIACAKIFEDLQTSDNDEIRLDDNKIHIDVLLMALLFLYLYPTEKKREAIFDKSPKTIREWTWYYVGKLQALKKEKVVWPDNFGNNIWVLYVDCVDCPVEESTHPELALDPDYYSFKLNSAGLRYELGTDLFRSALIWMNGPFLPGTDNDKGFFSKMGLRDKLESCGVKCIADGIYNGMPEVCSTFNAIDREDVAKFKARAQMRHEQFNGMIKEFKSMCTKFRNKSKHQMCFEAVAVVCIYRMENGEPLFDVLAGL